MAKTGYVSKKKVYTKPIPTPIETPPVTELIVGDPTEITTIEVTTEIVATDANPTDSAETVILPQEGEKQVSGVGDVIKAITTAIGITPCSECEERRKKLNRMFPFLQLGSTISQADADFVLSIKTTLSSQQQDRLIRIYDGTYKQKTIKCNCPGVYKNIIDKLLTQIEYQKDDATLQA